MNKKGFTLIELLAVLVIIGLIGLITVTSITSLLKHYKNNIYNKQIDNIEAAARVWGADNMLILPNDTTSTNTCNYSNINNCPTNYKILVIDLHTLQTGGYISNDLKNPKTKEPFENVTINITKNGNGFEYNVVTEEENNNSSSSTPSTPEPNGPTKVAAGANDTHKGIVYMDPTNLSATCTSSTAVSTTGTNTGCMKFYIYDDSGDTYKMILDHNTTAKVAYETSGTYKEYAQASIKTTVDDLVTTNGWQVTPRLITANEIATITNTITELENFDKWFYFNGTGTNKQTKVSSSQGDNEYAWLFNYTNGCESYGCNTTDSSTYGYWTSSPVSGSSKYAWNVYYSGELRSANVESNDAFGVRPVITIQKSALQ